MGRGPWLLQGHGSVWWCQPLGAWREAGATRDLCPHQGHQGLVGAEPVSCFSYVHGFLFCSPRYLMRSFWKLQPTFGYAERKGSFGRGVLGFCGDRNLLPCAVQHWSEEPV